MDSHPAVRRRARIAQRRGLAAQLPQGASATLLIVTDDPDFREPSVDDQTRIWRWRAADDRRKAGDFTGDVNATGTYDWTRVHPHVTVIVAMRKPKQGSAAAAAVAQANPRAGVLLVGALCPPQAGPLMRSINVPDALSQILEQELHTLTTLERIQALRAFAGSAAVVPILVHQDPDPDALASALAIRVILDRTHAHAPVLTLDEMTRPENRRMAELLDIGVTQVSPAELLAFDRIICADMQPRAPLVGSKVAASMRAAIIDHHPPEESWVADFSDVRPHYGATATILTEYLRALDENAISEKLATGLAYAIKTDTDNLTRGVSPADVEAYAFLLELADTTLLHRMERPALSDETARAYGRALAGLQLRGDLAVAYLGRLPIEDSHILADVADFCLSIDVATWAAAAAIVEGRLVITLRHFGGEPGAGWLARALAHGSGAGGGHASMARAVLPLDQDWRDLAHASAENACQLLVERLGQWLEHIR
ncbi:MAG: DHH family phosphoesterase [Longimicrobiales bacterium]